MNTAIHDGYDLGWKLAWVVLGWAGEVLLDTYDTERRPVAVHNLARSVDPDSANRDPVRELPADLGGRIPHAYCPLRRNVCPQWICSARRRPGGRAAHRGPGGRHRRLVSLANERTHP